MRFPKGCDFIADVRRQGFRPSGPVFLFLDEDRPRPAIYADMPVTCEVCIKPGDRIEDLDLRPLIDLDLTIHGGSVVSDRLRELLRAVVQARPRFVMGAVPEARFLFAWSPDTGWQYDQVANDE